METIGQRGNSSGSRVGDRLRAAREAKDKSVDEASHEAGIPVRYLCMLEEGRFPAVADPAYLTHFLRRYASYLKIDIDEVTREFLAQTEPDTTARRTGRKPPEAVLPKVRVRSASGRSRSFAIRSVLILIFALAGGGIAIAVVQLRGTWLPLSSAPPVGEMAKMAPPIAPTVGIPTVEIPTPVPREAPTETAEPAPTVAAEPTSEMNRPPDPVVVPDLPSSGADALPTPSGAAGESSNEVVERVNPEARNVRFFPPYVLEITATSKQVWIWMSIDGGPRQVTSLRQGETVRWVAQQGYTLSLDDAGGVRASLNGEELPRLGASGRARKRLLIPSHETAPSGGVSGREKISG